VSSDVLVRPAAPADPASKVIEAAFGDEDEQVSRIWDEPADSDTVWRSFAAAIDGDVVGGGTPLLFLEDDPGYDEPRGFEQASTHGFVPASARTPDDAFQVARFAGHQEWMTGQLIHRDVAWRHDAARLRDPLLAELERGDR
jgi:hypothetical protein